MRKTIINRYRDFADFNIIQYGHENCSPGYSIGNFVRSNYLIHYIHKGKGVYRVGDMEYELGANDAFLIYPDVITYYVADENDPWEYTWVEFSGTGVNKYLSATPFTPTNPVVYNQPAGDEAAIRLSETENSNPYTLMGAFYSFLGALATAAPTENSMADEYVKAAVSYVHTFYYHTNITVEEISDYVGIDRSYLFRLFKEKTGVSPKKYIMEYKLKHAAKLLKETNLSVGQVALSSGFDDQFYFSTAFRSYYGISPTKYRKPKERM